MAGQYDNIPLNVGTPENWQADAQDVNWTQAGGKTPWQQYLADVFGDAQQAETDAAHGLSFDIGTTPQQRSTATAQMGTAAPMQQRQTTVQPLSFEPISATALSLPSEMPMQQQEGQPNVFQPLQQYMKNLTPQQPADDANTNVRVVNGQVLLRIGEQWMPITQLPQQQSGG